MTSKARRSKANCFQSLDRIKLHFHTSAYSVGEASYISGSQEKQQQLHKQSLTHAASANTRLQNTLPLSNGVEKQDSWVNLYGRNVSHIQAHIYKKSGYKQTNNEK
jgi:hypothetical protein